MKYTRLLVSILVIACQPTRPLVADQNILKNPGFEELDQGSRPVGWSMPTDVYAVDTQVAHSGKNSLRIRSINPEVYRLTTQPIPFQIGRFYKMSVWVKTENVVGKETGATLCMEWNNDKGWLGGSYPAGFTGANDWKLLEADTGTVPPEAKTVAFVLYLRKGMTGTAWFDDACVTAAYPPPLTTFMVSPTYRGYLLPGADPQPVRIRMTLGNPLVDDLKLEEVRLTVNGKPVRVNPLNKQAVVDIDPNKLKPGDNSISVSLDMAASGKNLATQTYTVRKWKPGEALPKVYIDSHNRAIVEGKPFFPLGLYLGSGTKGDQPIQDLDTLARSPFNCLMNYGVIGGSLEDMRKYLDAVAERKLKILFSIKDVYEGTQYYPKQIDQFTGEKEIVERLVNEFKDHPALLAWYINDELPPPYIPRLEKRQQDMVRLDPDHPTWIVLYQVNDLRQYVNTTDVLGTDPYPIPDVPITHVTNYMQKTFEAVEGRRAMWMVPQCMNWSAYRKGEKPVRGPTYEEMRNMTFQCLVGGATGLVYYSFFDLKRDPAGFDKPWADICKVGEEVKGLSPHLLSAEEAPIITLKEPNESILFATRRWQGKKLLMAVNVSREEQKATFILPGKLKNVKRVNETGEVTVSGNQITETFPPVAVHLYQWE